MDDATRAAALTRLERFVGEWAVEARFSFTPEPIRGTLTFAWELDGQVLQQRSTVDHPAAPGVLALVSVADEGDGREYVQHYFDSRGVVRIYRMTLHDGEWTLLRDRSDFTPLNFAQRYTGTFGDEGRTITGRWELSHDGGASWEHDFDLGCRKIS
jgi:hypothetical protein